MVDWHLVTEIKPPLNQEQWQTEFDKYKQFPEFKKLNSNMTLEEFKSIYLYEWSHRNLGRTIGLAFALPLFYFTARGAVTGTLRLKLYGILVAIGLEGLLGWYMVQSGLKEDNPTPRVSQYRLASHLGSAFVIYSAMLWTALDMFSPKFHGNAAPSLDLMKNSLSTASMASSLTPALLKAQAKVRRLATGLTGLVFLTAISGAFVAGLDAGLIYNDFPFMGGVLIPAELWDMIPKWRNLFENDVTVQFNHRILGTTTVLSTAGLWFWTMQLRKVPLPPRTRLALHCLLGMACLQMTLGVSTLYTLVKTSVAATHQAGSLTLLSIALWLLHGLRRLPDRKSVV